MACFKLPRGTASPSGPQFLASREEFRRHITSNYPYSDGYYGEWVEALLTALVVSEQNGKSGDPICDTYGIMLYSMLGEPNTPAGVLHYQRLLEITTRDFGVKELLIMLVNPSHVGMLVNTLNEDYLRHADLSPSLVYGVGEGEIFACDARQHEEPVAATPETETKDVSERVDIADPEEPDSEDYSQWIGEEEDFDPPVPEPDAEDNYNRYHAYYDDEWSDRPTHISCCEECDEDDIRITHEELLRPEEDRRAFVYNSPWAVRGGCVNKTAHCCKSCDYVTTVCSTRMVRGQLPLNECASKRALMAEEAKQVQYSFWTFADTAKSMNEAWEENEDFDSDGEYIVSDAYEDTDDEQDECSQDAGPPKRVKAQRGPHQPRAGHDPLYSGIPPPTNRAPTHSPRGTKGPPSRESLRPGRSRERKFLDSHNCGK